MAQKVQVIFVDDLTGEETAEAETVSFGLDGSGYEIDLAPQNAAALRKALAIYVDKSRKVTPVTRPGERRPQAAAAPLMTRQAQRNALGAVRAWARENGYDIKDRGRVPADITAKYEAAVQSS